MKRLRRDIPVQEVHLNKLRQTPFYNFYEADAFNLQCVIVHEVVSRWTERPNPGCQIAEDVVQFSDTDVALITGLPLAGVPVTPVRAYRSRFVDTFFPQRKISEKAIVEAMRGVATKEDAESIEDTVRLVILYTMAVLLFPQTGGTVKSWMCFYLEELDRVGAFAWGKYAYNFLIAHVSATAHKVDRMKQGEMKITCLGGPAFVLQAWLYEHTKRWHPTDEVAYPRYRRWCGKPKAGHDKGRTRRWIHHGFMSRFGNKITPDEVITYLEITKEEMILMGGDVRRKRKRGAEEAHNHEGGTGFGDAWRLQTRTSGMGLSRRLSKRQLTPGPSDPPHEAQSKKTLRRLRRAITGMKQLERRVDDMVASSAVVKLETARMRDEAIKVRDEAIMARDEAHRLRDEAEGLKAEALDAKVNACRLRDEAAAFRDEAERIYADIAAVKDDFDRARGGYPKTCDDERRVFTDSSNWSEDRPMNEEGVSTTATSSSVHEVETAYNVAPLAVERSEYGVLPLYYGRDGGATCEDVANDGNEVRDDGVHDMERGGRAQEDGVQGADTAVGGPEDRGQGGRTTCHASKLGHNVDDDIVATTGDAHCASDDGVKTYFHGEGGGDKATAAANGSQDVDCDDGDEGVTVTEAATTPTGPADTTVHDVVAVADAGPTLRRSTRFKKQSSTLTSPYTVSHVRRGSMRLDTSKN